MGRKDDAIEGVHGANDRDQSRPEKTTHEENDPPHGATFSGP